MPNHIITFNVKGMNACFTDPVTKAGGEQYSYPVPTYAALRGIADNIYYKPTFRWHIRRVRVLNKIQYETKAVKFLRITDKIVLGEKPNAEGKQADLGFITLLRDVSYNVEAEMVWDTSHPELASDRDFRKHMAIAERSVKAGGRRVIYFGKREGNCYGEVTPCVFEEGEGYYDNIDAMPLGVMVHGITYKSENPDNATATRLWSPIMRNGVIEFPWPSDCPINIKLHDKDKQQKVYTLGIDLKSCEEEERESWL